MGAMVENNIKSSTQRSFEVGSSRGDVREVENVNQYLFNFIRLGELPFYTYIGKISEIVADISEE